MRADPPFKPRKRQDGLLRLVPAVKPIWIGVGFVLLLLVIFYFALTRMTRYFDRLSEALDHLADDTDEEIRLPAELDFMEKRLNAVRQTLRKREKDAKEAEQRKNDLVVYLAHDIKTPLTSVIGYLSLLDEAPDMPAAQRAKYLDITLRKPAGSNSWSTNSSTSPGSICKPSCSTGRR